MDVVAVIAGGYNMNQYPPYIYGQIHLRECCDGDSGGGGVQLRLISATYRGRL